MLVCLCVTHATSVCWMHPKLTRHTDTQLQPTMHACLCVPYATWVYHSLCVPRMHSRVQHIQTHTTSVYNAHMLALCAIHNFSLPLADIHNFCPPCTQSTYKSTCGWVFRFPEALCVRVCSHVCVVCHTHFRPTDYNALKLLNNI